MICISYPAGYRAENVRSGRRGFARSCVHSADEFSTGIAVLMKISDLLHTGLHRSRVVLFFDEARNKLPRFQGSSRQPDGEREDVFSTAVQPLLGWYPYPQEIAGGGNKEWNGEAISVP